MSEACKQVEYCDECNHASRTLHSFPYQHPYAGAPKVQPNWPGKYCLRCIGDFQDICRIPRMDRLCKCGGPYCLIVLPRKMLVCHERLEKGGRHYCQPCLDTLIDRQKIVCVTCGQKTLDYTYLSRERSTCKDCYIKPPLWQAVTSQNSRARAQGLPATLTDDQWDRALSYFDNKCAYCVIEPYQELEHFIPITKGGGTTADNCVPACASCNGRKSNHHPDKITHLFPPDNLARIRAYLQNQTI